MKVKEKEKEIEKDQSKEVEKAKPSDTSSTTDAGKERMNKMLENLFSMYKAKSAASEQAEKIKGEISSLRFSSMLWKGILFILLALRPFHKPLLRGLFTEKFSEYSSLPRPKKWCYPSIVQTKGRWTRSMI